MSKDDGQTLEYTPQTAHYWPSPATKENKVVHQLDDITQESEERACEIFDIIESICNDLLKKEKQALKTIEILNVNERLFVALSTKFTHISVFRTQLEKNRQAIEDANKVLHSLQKNSVLMMDVMEIMQYQDVHRQKIQRVINVMRSLSSYMNSLFEGRFEDKKRVSSTQHISKSPTEELVSNDEIDALLAQFAKMKI